ncbi:oligosaccharide flippase family protein [Pseudoalteromonas sp. ZZD1]|uniref:oligosaccharide flippase family protein n=1 Tax=Pseudoalteromonas sp. ZZD1 TaxID=3139395 RepID=UPI003BA9CEBA
MSLLKSPLLAKVLTVLAGGILAQLIAFLAIPLVTRIYDPYAFGLFANVTQTAAFLVPVISLCLPLIIVLLPFEKEVKPFIKSAISTSMLLTLILLLASTTLLFFQFFDVFTTVVLSILFAGSIAIQELYMYQYIRESHFSLRAKLLVVQALMIAVMKLGFGLSISNEYYSLVFASIAGYTLANCFCYYNLRLYLVTTRFNRFKHRIKCHKDIVKYRVPLNIIDNLSLLLPILFLTYFSTPVAAGLFALARTVLVMPGNIIGKSLADVLLPKFVSLHKEKQPLNNALIKYTLYLLLFGFIPVIAFINFSGSIFSLIFSEKWSDASLFANWLVFWVYINVVNKPYSSVIPIFKVEKLYLFNGLLNFVLTISALFIAYAFELNAVDSIMIYAVATFIPQLIVIIIGWLKARAYDDSIIGKHQHV